MKKKFITLMSVVTLASATVPALAMEHMLPNPNATDSPEIVADLNKELEKEAVAKAKADAEAKVISDLAEKVEKGDVSRPAGEYGDVTLEQDDTLGKTTIESKNGEVIFNSGVDKTKEAAKTSEMKPEAKKEEAKPEEAKPEVKPAAKPVAKADTKTVAKALPKTSAVK